MYTQYHYSFITYFFAPRKEPHIFQIIASNDLTAMKAWCKNESVQDMNMHEIEKTVITRVRIED